MSLSDRQAGEGARVEELERQLAASVSLVERAEVEASERQRQLVDVAAAMQSEAAEQGEKERSLRAKVNNE